MLLHIDIYPYHNGDVIHHSRHSQGSCNVGPELQANASSPNFPSAHFYEMRSIDVANHEYELSYHSRFIQGGWESIKMCCAQRHDLSGSVLSFLPLTLTIDCF